MMDSHQIALRLNELYPQSSLKIADDPYLAEVESLADKVASTVMPDFIPKIAKNVLGESSLPYWRRTREEWFGGMKLEVVGVELGGPKVYDEARRFVQRIAELLMSDVSGPYFQGQKVSYADFVWCSLLHFFEKLGEESLEMLLGADGDGHNAHCALLEACRPWLKRDDH
jgi:glutathione S-transferase